MLDMANFIYYFDRKDPNCFYWAFKICYRREKGARRFKRTDCEYIIWEYLFQKGKGNKYLDEITCSINWRSILLKIVENDLSGSQLVL